MTGPVILYVFLSLFYTISATYLYRKFMCLKKSKYAYIAICYAINVSNVFFVDIYLEPAFTIIRGMIIFLMDFVLLHIFFEGTTLKKAVLYCENNILLMLAEVLGQQLLFNIMEYSMDMLKNFTYLRDAGLVLAVLIYFAILSVVIFFQKRNIHFILSDKKGLLVIAYFMVQIICYVFLMGAFFTNHNHMELYPYIAILSIVCLVAYIYILQIFSSMEVKEQTEKNICYIKEQSEMAVQYYEQIADKMRNLDKLQNDYAKELQSIYHLSGIETDILKKEDSIDKPRILEISQNILVSKIVSNVKIQLEKMKCVYDIKMDIPEDVQIKQMDLSGLLLNLFDNAIEAITVCQKEMLENQPFILEAGAEYKNHQLTIWVKNTKSPLQKIRRLDNRYVTTKKNKEAHGYGLQIIEKIAKEYGGRMQVRYASNWFENRVILKI